MRSSVMNRTSITVNNLSVTLQGVKVLDAISFRLDKNQHLLIQGSSSSGKTTLAKALCGTVFSTGLLDIQFDEQVELQPKIRLVELRHTFKNLSHTNDFYYQQRFNSFDAGDAPTLREELLGDLSPALRRKAEIRLENLLTKFGLQHRKDAPVIQLSSGEHKKLQLIRAFLQPPQILVLDNPYLGLDAITRVQLNSYLEEMAVAGVQLLLIADIRDIPACITHIALLEKGRLMAFDEISKDGGISQMLPKQFPLLDHRMLPEAGHNRNNFREIARLVNVSVNFGEKQLFQNICWTILPGERWLVKGTNGAGKSTLLSLITGDNPQAYANEIYLFDRKRGSGESIWDLKKRIGYISPELHAYFDRNCTCSEAIASGFFDTVGLYKKLKPEQQQILAEWIGYFSLGHILDKPLAMVSGGEQRMVMLARALVKNPPLLVLDEPCQGLDEYQKNEFIQVIDELCEYLDKTMIYVSHYDNELPGCITGVLQLENKLAKIYPVDPARAIAV